MNRVGNKRNVVQQRMRHGGGPFGYGQYLIRLILTQAGFSEQLAGSFADSRCFRYREIRNSPKGYAINAPKRLSVQAPRVKGRMYGMATSKMASAERLSHENAGASGIPRRKKPVHMVAPRIGTVVQGLLTKFPSSMAAKFKRKAHAKNMAERV